MQLHIIPRIEAVLWGKTTGECIRHQNIFQLKDHAFKQFIDEVQAQLRTVFREPVSSMLKETSVILMTPVDHQQWSPYEKLSHTDVINNMHLGGRLVNELQWNVHENVSNELNFYSEAKLVNADKYGGGHKIYAQSKLHSGSVFSIIKNGDKNNSVAAAGTMDSKLVLFSAIGLVWVGNRSLWGNSPLNYNRRRRCSLGSYEYNSSSSHFNIHSRVGYVSKMQWWLQAYK